MICGPRKDGFCAFRVNALIAAKESQGHRPGVRRKSKEGVDNFLALSFPLDQAAHSQDSQVVRDGRLGEFKRKAKVGYVGGQLSQGQQYAQARRVAKQLEKPRQLLRVSMRPGHSRALLGPAVNGAWETQFSRRKQRRLPRRKTREFFHRDSRR